MGFQSQILGAMGSVAAAKKFAEKKAAGKQPSAEPQDYTITEPYNFWNENTMSTVEPISYQPVATFSEEKSNIATKNLVSNRMAKKLQHLRYKDLLAKKKSVGATNEAEKVLKKIKEA